MLLMPNAEGLGLEDIHHGLTPLQEVSTTDASYWEANCTKTILKKTITETVYETLEEETLAGGYGFGEAYTTVCSL